MSLGKSASQLSTYRAEPVILSDSFHVDENTREVQLDAVPVGRMTVSHMYNLGTMRFPGYYFTKDRHPIFGRKGSIKHGLIEIPVAFHEERRLERPRPQPKFGNYGDYHVAMKELQLSSSHDDFLNVARKYNFPVGFLEACFEAVNSASGEENLKELKRETIEIVVRTMRLSEALLTNDQVTCDINVVSWAAYHVLRSDRARWADVIDNWADDPDRMVSETLQNITNMFRRYAVIVGLISTALLIGLVSSFYLGFDLINFGITACIGGIFSAVGWLARGMFNSMSKIKENSSFIDA